MNDPKKDPTKVVDVVLAKDHTHAGRKYKAGATIKVTEPERAWLLSNQVIASKEIVK